ncbi:MAG TPA: hypothetical protein VLA02_08580 [Reyranella sp.]|nr:hypothetical protein [Reyranella sp.]
MKSLRWTLFPFVLQMGLLSGRLSASPPAPACCVAIAAPDRPELSATDRTTWQWYLQPLTEGAPVSVSLHSYQARRQVDASLRSFLARSAAPSAADYFRSLGMTCRPGWGMVSCERTLPAEYVCRDTAGKPPPGLDGRHKGELRVHVQSRDRELVGVSFDVSSTGGSTACLVRG